MAIPWTPRAARAFPSATIPLLQPPTPQPYSVTATAALQQFGPARAREQLGRRGTRREECSQQQPTKLTRSVSSQSTHHVYLIGNNHGGRTIDREHLEGKIIQHQVDNTNHKLYLSRNSDHTNSGNIIKHLLQVHQVSTKVANLTDSCALVSLVTCLGPSRAATASLATS